MQVAQGRELGPRFAGLLRAHRLGAGLSQQELAERAGLSAKAIGALERGRRRAPYRDTVAMLARALDLGGDDLALFGETASRARLRLAVAEPAAAGSGANNLPAQITSFVGRESELEDLSRLLQQHRLVTVTGSGGLGKTRLALESASRYSGVYKDGVWFVELASLSDRASVVAKIASALSVLPGDGDAVASLAQALAECNLLIVIDNCEHVLPHVASVVTTILKACPNVDVLATSRERLALSGEVTYRISSLSMPDPGAHMSASDAQKHAAIRLFVERAQMADPHFALSDAGTPAVADICRKLDGIALAIEIAAARMPFLGLLNLRLKIDDCRKPLTSPFVDAPLRHRTLTSAIDWSYKLLTASERALFRRLSVFARGFTVEGARAVCMGPDVDDAEVATLLSSLVDKSLVIVESAADVRYVFLESTREFASDKLREAGERDGVMRSFLAWATAFARTTPPGVGGDYAALNSKRRLPPVDGSPSAAAATAVAKISRSQR